MTFAQTMLRRASDSEMPGQSSDGIAHPDEQRAQANQAEIAAMLSSVRDLAESGRTEEALEKLIAVRARGMDDGAVSAETRVQLFEAAQVHERCVAAGDLERALKLCDLLVKVCPSVALLHKARLDTLTLAQRRNAERTASLGRQHYHAMCDHAAALLQEGDLQGELKCRLELLRHPFAATRHSVFRIINASYAVSRVLSVEFETFDAERLALARTLLTDIATIPASPADPDDVHGEDICAWERAVRMLFGTIDLDAIFGRPIAPTPPLRTSFVAASGAALAMADITARRNALGAQVLFVTSSSEEYLGLHAKTYISSILQSCDCPCMVFIYLCIPEERLSEVAASVGIDDPRVIYCFGAFDAPPVSLFYSLGSRQPVATAGIYYASAGLLHLDTLLDHLCLPACVTGIDTVLQRGVADLIARFQGADMVLNKLGPHLLLGSQLVNSLVLVYPTANGRLFVEFLKSYLGRHLSQQDQPESLDQLDLEMARLHVTMNGAAPDIRYFDPLDINNCMFNRATYRKEIDHIKSYRFLNVFMAGSHGDQIGQGQLQSA